MKATQFGIAAFLSFTAPAIAADVNPNLIETSLEGRTHLIEHTDVTAADFMIALGFANDVLNTLDLMRLQSSITDDQAGELCKGLDDPIAYEIARDSLQRIIDGTNQMIREEFFTSNPIYSASAEATRAFCVDHSPEERVAILKEGSHDLVKSIRAINAEAGTYFYANTITSTLGTAAMTVDVTVANDRFRDGIEDLEAANAAFMSP